MMTKKEKLQLDTLKAQLAAEKERSAKEFEAYGDALHELVSYKIKLDRIHAVMKGEA